MRGYKTYHIVQQGYYRDCCKTDCNNILYTGSSGKKDYKDARAYAGSNNTHLLKHKRHIPRDLRAQLFCYYNNVI